jgi:hypothetical protein
VRRRTPDTQTIGLGCMSSFVTQEWRPPASSMRR